MSGRVIDLGPYLEEATRMLNGEIPFSQGYLNELIPVGVTVNMVCGKCGALLFAYTCPECQLVARRLPDVRRRRRLVRVPEL